jgi:ATP-dependent RNA helicase DeaD
MTGSTPTKPPHGAGTPNPDRVARRKAKKQRKKAERAAARAAQKGSRPGRKVHNRSKKGASSGPPRPAAPPAEEPPAEEPPAEEPPAEEPPPEEPLPDVPPFSSFALRPELLEAVAEQGFERPTPIQLQAIPAMLEGRDVVGQAQTGTGKTAAFALPILHRLDPARRVVQALVLVPTRELANQVCRAFATLSGPLGGISTLAVYGGQPIVTQFRELNRGVHVVVGTPGRVMDHLRRESLSLAETTAVVIDEADEMLNMGFIEDVEWILEQAAGPEQRQTSLFSATLPQPVRRVAERHLTDPLSIAIEPEAPAIATIDQRFLWVPAERKLEALDRLLEMEDGDSVLVFTRTRLGAADLADALTAAGHAVEALHGDMQQTQRESVLRRFRSGAVRIVVATDVAARGLDVDGIGLVVNFDAPGDPETYVHRIGRTGRAGRAGVSALFLMQSQRRVLAGIQRYTRQRLQLVRLPTERDVAAHRVDRFKAAVSRAVETEDLDRYRRVVEEIARDGGHDMAAVAAAVAHLAAGDHRQLPSLEARSREPRPGSEETTRSPQRPGMEMATLALSVGRTHGLGPGDVVGAIANEAGIPGKAVGAIQIDEFITFVDVDVRHVNRVLSKIHGTRVRNQRVRIRRARPGEKEPRRGDSFSGRGRR